MTPEHWQQVDQLYHAALEDRAVLEKADPELRREVESLLAHDGPALDRPAWEGAAELLDDTRTQLTSGTQLGPYRIDAALGAGGMGEVFRAVDTRLGRKVAIKIAAKQFSERFEREARAIAALNHPNICHLYDVGPNYLVMELVEGETLAARLKRGALPLPLALQYGSQIADALAAAHAKGIVHRDLKPGNIMVAKSGIKVLDFGLAKSGQDETLTAPNAVMGTSKYMAPEQREGKQCDARTDIYGLGLVLREMAGDFPPQFAHVVERCMESEPENRWQAASDVKRELEWAGKTAGTTEVATQATESRKGLPRWIWGVAASVLGLGLVAAGAAWFLKPKPEQPMLQMEINPPEGAKFVTTLNPFALSPDGRRIAFVATGKDGKQMLWLRSIDSSSAAVLAGTENANGPFWSPDSRWVGFSANGKLQKVDVVTGGQPQVICDIKGRITGAWNSEGVIAFAQGTTPIQRVSAAGGTPVPVLSFDAARQEDFQASPYFLPDGKHFVYYSNGEKSGDNSMLASLDGKLNRILIEGGTGVKYGPNPRGGGSLFYNMRGQGTEREKLHVRPFDVDKLEFTGPPAVIADAVPSLGWWSASADGLLALRHRYPPLNQLTWLGRDGHSMGTLGDPGPLSTPRISPDQKTVAFSRKSEQNDDIWTFDLTRNTPTQVTFKADNLTRNTSTQFAFEENLAPIWSSDGKSIVYGSFRNGVRLFVERPANGVGPETVLASQDYLDFPTAVSHDGRWLVLVESTSLHSIIALRSLENPNKVVRIPDREMERDGSISPDGRWLLYSSVPATRREVLVQSVPKEAGGSPNATGKWQISTAGGSQPVWRADGKEIFYVAPDGMMMAVPAESTGQDFFHPGVPKPLFQTRLDLNPTFTTDLRQFDVTADGQRFLLNQRLPDNSDPPINVIVNWPKLLEK